ncbi:MAG TPA: ATP-binding protein [Bacilli bacterium]|jgi:predicted AAA+ superfamily ATPase|nr:ATP-binding protein [Bacilli bacterium]HOE06316.1 ATP-binding protein [Bacilli bacterium]HOR17430.1 ATP-binding protein [Bacilli bacterium]HPL55222.1 ATP-binding protein [Bacilli bacterium]
MKLIERTLYLDRLKRVRNTPDIKIITGIRRSGKSELMRSYLKYIKETEPETNIIEIDYGNLKYDDIKDYKSLYSYVESNYKPNTKNVLMIDEVQLCREFEIAVNSLHNSKKYDIYLTGSNAFLLSSDLSTLFTGRFIEISVFPFSFKEYLEYFEIEDNFSNHLENYLKVGGLAGSYLYEKKEDSNAYIKNVYTSLIKRDLVDRYNIEDISLLDTLTEFLMDNISNLTTANNISNILNNKKIKANHVTIGNYIKYLCNAFMFYKVKRYDIRGKKYLEINDKYYLSDLSFRYSILGVRNMDYGRAYENVIAIELLRRGYDIYVGKLYEKEIDFIAIKGSEKIYIQVSDNISREETLKREIAPLIAIKDAYPKIILANTTHPMTIKDGVKIFDLARWLIDDKN